MTTDVRITQLTQLVYDNQLVRKRTDTIYVCTDSHNIYYGFDLIFQEDDYKIMSIDDENFKIKLTAIGPGGSMIISITEYETTYQAVKAILELVGFAYRLVGDINSSDISQNLLTANNLGNVYNVIEPFEVTSENKNLFIDSIQIGTYPQNSKILIVNTGTEENPIYKFDITATGNSGNIKSDWNALPGSDAEILNKPHIPTKTSDLTNDSDFITHQDISGKADKTNTVENVLYTNKKLQKTINGSTSDVVSVSSIKTDLELTKEDVGLSNVTNDAQIKRDEMGVAEGVATLDSVGKVPLEQLPEFEDIDSITILDIDEICI